MGMLLTRLKLNEPLIAADVIDGEAVIMNLGKGHYYSLVDTSADIWRMLMAGWTGADAAAALAARYGIEPGIVRADVEKFIGLLAAEDILVADSAPPAVPGAFPDLAPGYDPPVLSTFSDIKDLLALDPPLPDYFTAGAM